MKAIYLAGVAFACPAMLVTAPHAALAQTVTSEPQTETTPQSAEADSGSGKDIIVNAQRRDEALQDVPIAVTVFTSENRDRLGIRTIQDFANVTPGLTFSASLDRLALRGVGRLTNTIGSDPGVAVYNDGFYTASNAEASKTPMFVERIEILRGPQGTLYGRNSVGGSINVVSKRPKDFVEGEFRFLADRYNGLTAESYLSGPIVGNLKGRVSVQMGPRKVEESWHNIGPTGDEGYLNRFLVEAQLQYDFSDKVQLWLKYSHAEWRDHYRSSNLVTPYSTAEFLPSGALVPNPGFGYTVANPGVNDPRTFNANTMADQKLTNNHNFVANFTADLGGVTLKYVGGYSQYVYTAYSDLDNTAAGQRTQAATLGAFTYNPTYIQEYIEDKQYYSNEVTLSNSGNDAFNWIIGGYQFHEDYYQPVTWYQGGAGTDMMAAAMANPVCVDATYTPQASCAANPQRAFYRGTGNLVTDSYAAFGQADLEVSPGLKFTAGLRYSWDKKVGDETYRLVNYNPVGSNICTIPGFGTFFFAGCGPFARATDITRYVLVQAGSGPAARTLEDSWDGLSWRFGADYKVNDRTLIFASYSRGLKAGGFNLGSFARLPLVDKETVDAFEIGFKSSPADGFMLNVTGFYYDYKNAQIPISVPITGTALNTTNFFNIPKSRSLGVEVETRWNVTPQFEISGTYSYLDATIRRGPQLFDDPNVAGNNPVSIDGNRSPASSRHKVSVSALYDVPLGDGGNLFLAASYAYRSDAYYDVFESARGRAPGWDQVDARITYVDPSQRFTLIAFARNLFDTLGYDGASGNGGTSAAGFGQTYSYTPPQTFGFEFQVKF